VQAKVLNGDLEAVFQRWHPGLSGAAETRRAA